jgi:hypothetical protein
LELLEGDDERVRILALWLWLRYVRLGLLLLLLRRLLWALLLLSGGGPALSNRLGDIRGDLLPLFMLGMRFLLVEDDRVGLRIPICAPPLLLLGLAIVGRGFRLGVSKRPVSSGFFFLFASGDLETSYFPQPSLAIPSSLL